MAIIIIEISTNHELTFLQGAYGIWEPIEERKKNNLFLETTKSFDKKLGTQIQ